MDLDNTYLNKLDHQYDIISDEPMFDVDAQLAEFVNDYYTK